MNFLTGTQIYDFKTLREPENHTMTELNHSQAGGYLTLLRITVYSIVLTYLLHGAESFLRS